MAEKLLTKYQTAERLGMAGRTFNHHRPKLIAAGLQVVYLGKKPRFVERSVDALIARAAKRGKLF